MAEFSMEEDWEEEAKRVLKLVVLGHEWGILESRIATVDQ